MKVNFFKDKNNYEADFSKGIDISIPLLFNEKQPNIFNVKKATSKPYKDESFIGDTRKGGPCNFETLCLTPHCNGTHTECIGHITKKRVSVLDTINEEIILSTLVTIEPEISDEKYKPKAISDELVITRKQLSSKLKNKNHGFLDALVIRTLPNTLEKKERDYMNDEPPYFTLDAMKFIVSLGVKHLLVDVPSVDRLYDEGLLSAHNTFWETKEKKMNLNAINKSITEMIYVPNDVKDGKYLLNLQIAPFSSDAAPSRPKLYKINEL